uniref:Predicted protein n=1 Tax=Physcomitrium patens TaxID=3218 RepID=A9U7A7_PHYPA
MTTMIGKNSVKTSFRATASVIALAIASLTVPTLAQAKRMGSGGKSVRPASIGKAPAQPAAPAAPTASKAATPASPAAPATPAAPAAPAAAAAPAATPATAGAAGPGMMGTLGAAAVGAVAGSMAGNALAGAMTPEKDAAAKEAEAKAKAAETEAAELQRKADEAKAKAEAARAAANGCFNGLAHALHAASSRRWQCSQRSCHHHARFHSGSG